MNIKKTILLGLVIGMSLAAYAQTVPLQIRDSLQHILDNFLMEDDIPGGIMAVHHRSDNWIWKGQGGVANIATMQAADTAFHYRIGSVSKNFMAVTILHLVDKGILSLNDTIGQWLSPTLINAIPYSEQITIKQLLNHTSGIYSYTDDTAFLLTLLTNPNASFTPNDLINIALTYPPNFLPGTNWAYNNTGYVLLTKIVETATGMSYASYATDSLLAPLALTSTYYPDTTIIATNHMRCYADYNVDMVLEDYTDVTTTWATGSGEIVATLDDQIRYFNALLDGQLISPTAYNELRTPFYPSSSYTYGLGMYIIDSVLVGHSGLYFSTTGLWYYEDLDVVIAYQFNRFDVDTYNKILLRIYQLLTSSTVSVREPTSQAYIDIYPNPAKHTVSIQLNEDADSMDKLVIYDAMGKVVKSYTLLPTANQLTIDVRDVNSGMYILAIYGDGHLLGKKKLIIASYQ